MKIMSEHSRDQRESEISENGNLEKLGQKRNGTYYIDDTMTVHGDVLMWDLDDIDVEHPDNLSDHITSLAMTPTTYLQPKDTEVIPTSPIAPKLSIRLSPVDKEKTYPKRPIFSPTDAMETFIFRDLFPNPELKLKKTNRLGKTDTGGAFVIDDNITMHGDVMMLDLENEGEGHSDHTYTAVEKFNQLTETPMTTTKPVNKRTTTTGIRHLMAIRNPELAELPNDSGINTGKKLEKTKRKSKHGKFKEDVACVSRSQNRRKELSRVITPTQEAFDVTANTAKRRTDFVELIRCQMSRFGAFIHRKLICR